MVICLNTYVKKVKLNLTITPYSNCSNALTHSSIHRVNSANFSLSNIPENKNVIVWAFKKMLSLNKKYIRHQVAAELLRLSNVSLL